MKEEILKRAMFTTPSSKKTMNSGIMSGFEDEMEDESKDENEDMPPMARTPQNPEILMNNLRGDMRSVDARYLELAQMVGEQAAMDTPPEVLAMLQPQLAAQAAPPMPQGGIGALAQGSQMAPPPMMGQAMPSGMEGMPPFPQGGAEQAPPTPDGMPPLRAADGVFVTQGARQSMTDDPNSPLYIPPRFNDLTSGRIPEDQMTEAEKRFLKTYKFGMGFTGGSIRDVASQGFGRLSSALSPYVQRGINYLDEIVTPFIRPGYRVTPMTEGGRRAVIQGRENIVQGTRGAEMGTGTRLQAANTLNVGRVPFSQAVKENPLLGRVVDVSKKYPASTLAGTTLTGGTLYALSGDKNPAPRSEEELKAVNALINQIPGQGPPLYDARGNRIIPPGIENQIWEPNFPGEMPPPPPEENPANATINQIRGEAEPRTDISPFPSLIKPPAAEVKQTLPVVGEKKEATAAEDVNKFIKDNLKQELSTKTRGERIKAEYQTLEPTFRELLGDTKSDARTNALLLLADAGFKFASTYRPTVGMALGEALSGVPRGFAAIVAQARDRDIKIKTAALQQATDNVNLQDKIARDFQLEELRINGRVITEGIKAKNARDLEELKQRGTWRNTVYNGDKDLLLKQLEMGNVIEEDGGMGLTIQKTKSGSYIGSYVKPDQNGNLPPPVRSAIDSRWTLRETDNPFVQNRGPAPSFVETDKAERVKLGTSLRGLDDSLRALDDLRGQYAQLYSPGTWFTDKINNVIVPVTGGLVRPDVDQAAAATRISSGLNQVMKRIASANDQGRVAVQEQEWARDMLGGLTNPTAFFSNKEIAAKQFATMEAQLRNARQQVLTQLGFITNDFSMDVPSTGTQNDPFVIPADSQGQQRMFRYLGSTIGTLQDPRAAVYLRLPNGKVDAFNPSQLRGLVQK